MRAGVDIAPLERPQAHSRRSDLLRDFFKLCTGELREPGGAAARSFLERRGFSGTDIDQLGFGVVPNELFTKSALRRPATPSSRSHSPACSQTAAGPAGSAEPGETSAERSRTLWARASRLRCLRALPVPRAARAAQACRLTALPSSCAYRRRTDGSSYWSKD